MKFRTDLQAMRGFAVLIVVLQHANPSLLRAGYLGVDVFFVISGFLITGLVARAIDRGDFRFGEFYFRRAKRLLPAAYVTFLATAIAAVFLLDAREWNDFSAQLAGAATWTGNIVLWRQTGYFEGAAALKPLLHVWSLSVEEQFYLLLPAALVLMPRRWWLGGIAVALGASLALYLVWMQTRPDAAFYLLPTRAWQLALGAAAALVARHARVQALATWLFWPALATLLAVPVLPLGLSPQAMAIAVCAAATVVVLRAHPAVQTLSPVRALARVGDFSYSLYLVHWPVFAFLHNVHAGDPALGAPSTLVLSLAVLASIAGGWLLYRTVELPVRNARIAPSRRVVVAATVATVALMAMPIGISARARVAAKQAGIDYAWLRRDNVGFSAACEFYQSFEPIAACRNAAHPQLLVWGDSFAMQLVPGILASSPRLGVVQATKSSCGPFVGIAQYTDAFPRAYALNCLSFNSAVLDYMLATPSIRTVVLSSAFYPYFDAERHLVQRLPDGNADLRPGEAIALRTLRATIDAIRAAGKRVVLVAPPPSTGFDYTHCLERKARGRTVFGSFTDCSMPLAEYRASKAMVHDFLARISRDADVDVISFDDLLCDETRCATELDGTFLYRDEGHLSYDGARLVGRRMDLGRRVQASAR
jgi:peptidoglycan/LPS O-acetylase OafA/YrhL